MDWRLIAVVASLGMDTFAVSVGLGLSGGLTTRRRLLLAGTFAAAEAAMPLFGVLIGTVVGRLVGQWADVVAGVVLLGLGAYMFREDDDDEERLLSRLAGGDGGAAGDGDPPLSAGVLILAALSVSTDEMAAGLSLGALHLPIGLTAALIGLQAFVLSLVGIALGRAVGERVREGAERLAGLVLMALGAVVLFDAVRTLI